jgi:hypothetical protein
MTRQEFIKLLEKTGYTVFWEEIKDTAPADYIVITQLNDLATTADNKSHFVFSEFQVQFITEDRFNINSIKNFMFENFICKSVKSYDSESNMWILTYYDIRIDFKV